MTTNGLTATAITAVGVTAVGVTSVGVTAVRNDNHKHWIYHHSLMILVFFYQHFFVIDLRMRKNCFIPIIFIPDPQVSLKIDMKELSNLPRVNHILQNHFDII